VLAIASQSPVVPTIVHGAREVMPKGSFWIRPGTVDLHFLEPVLTAGLEYDDRTELMTEVWARMADALDELYGVRATDDPVANQA
ncbi:MAG TPA: hypothetical protein VK636_15695, partial [Gemmatimonadaceae bacterium]|nr:hypothetical protein [Gemmatimonadaceae bacterium]